MSMFLLVSRSEDDGQPSGTPILTRSNIDYYEAEIQKLKRQIASLEIRLDQPESDIEHDFLQKYIALQHDRDRLQNQLGQLQKSVTSLSTKLENEMDQRGKLEAELSTVQESEETLTAKYTRVTKKFTELKKAYHLTSQSHQQLINEKKQADLAQLHEKQNRENRHDHAQRELALEHERLTGEVQSLHESVKEITEANAELRRCLSVAKSDLVRATDANAQLKAVLTRAAADSKELAQERNLLKSRMASLLHDKEQIIAKAVELQTQVQSSESSRQALQLENARLKCEKEDLERRSSRNTNGRSQS
jgi:chromosome segregation ATPase